MVSIFNFFKREDKAPQQTFSTPYSVAPISVVQAIANGLAQGGSGPVSREEALTVPAVVRGRNMICNIATLPLVTLDPSRKKVREPLFEQIDPNVPNVVVLSQTIEDLLFDGIAWWKVTDRGWNGFPTHAQHVDAHRVSLTPPKGYLNLLPSGVDPDSVVWIDGKPVHTQNVIRFDSPNPPISHSGRRVIRRAILIEQTAEMYALDPRPMDYFTPADNVTAPAEPEQVQNILNGWAAARRKRATGYVPETLKYETVQSPTPVELQLAQLQDRAARDIANEFGIDPEDLGISTTSRTYQNATDRRQDRVNDVLSGYMLAVTQRLSMGDITRQGYRVVFDLDDYMRADPTTRWATYQTAHAMGVMDVPEIRELEDLPLQIAPAQPAPKELEAPVENHKKESNMETFNDGTMPETFQFGSDDTTFTVDEEARTITGLAVPYNVEGSNGRGKFVFKKGAIQWKKSAVSRVKLLRDHNWDSLLGAATRLDDTELGLIPTFKVARGPAGDQALAEAADGALDGLSIGIRVEKYSEKDGVIVVESAYLDEVSLTPRPAFDDARVTKVTASNTPKGTSMSEETVTPDVASEDFNAAVVAAVNAALAANKNAEDKPANVNPVRPVTNLSVTEASPYRFNRAGQFVQSENEFSTDLFNAIKAGDVTGENTPAGKRAFGALAFVASGDVGDLNPTIARPDMYVDQKDHKTPLWNAVNKGGLPNGVNPFRFPKRNSAANLVNPHTEGVEPTKGTFTTTGQTVTPGALSGKTSITREVYDMGGNPQISNLIWNEFTRSWDEGLETATAAFLNTLTAATDIALTAGSADGVLAGQIKTALTRLAFARGYDFDMLALEQELFVKLGDAKDADGRPLFPVLGATNADGTNAEMFDRLKIGGYVGVPSWALASTAGSVNNSWLFDSTTVHGWATGPQRLELQGTDADGDPAGVAFIDIAIWGYSAFANTDIGGVRQITYDTTA